MIGNPSDVSFLYWGFFSTNNVFTFFIDADLLSALLKNRKICLLIKMAADKYHVCVNRHNPRVVILALNCTSTAGRKRCCFSRLKFTHRLIKPLER